MYLYVDSPISFDPSIKNNCCSLICVAVVPNHIGDSLGTFNWEQGYGYTSTSVLTQDIGCEVAKQAVNKGWRMK